jgi:predicted ATPase
MAYPNAKILHLGEAGIEPICYSDTEHYAVTKHFMSDPAGMMEELFTDC